MKLFVLLAILSLPGCALVATPPGAGVTGAALGLAASALDLDTEILKVWEDRNPPAPQEETKP